MLFPLPVIVPKDHLMPFSLVPLAVSATAVAPASRIAGQVDKPRIMY
jgi:hypothetical protein